MTIDKSEEVARHLMANSELERSRSYLARGRRFKDMPVEELQDRFVQSYRTWVDDLTNANAQQEGDDLGVEFGLRSLNVPFDLIKPEVQRLIDQVTANLDRVSEARLSEINEEMVAEYEASTKQRN